MKLMVKSWNNGSSTYNAEAEETTFVSYQLVHQFNRPAQATITLADPSGTVMQKYNVDDNDVYIGPGHVTIEDPTGTDIFVGRIIKANHNTTNGTVTLYCEDWLSQLKDEKIDYDMREDLDGAGLRESYAHADIDNGTASYRGPAYKSGDNSFLIDDNRTGDYAIDEYNGMKLISSLENAGDITIVTGPYDETVTANVTALDTDSPVDGEQKVWEDDANYHQMEGTNSEGWYVDYKFKIFVTDSSLYNSLDAMRLVFIYQFEHSGEGDETFFVYPIPVDNYVISRGEITPESGDIQRHAWDLSVNKITPYIDANGELEIRFLFSGSNATCKLHVYQVSLEMDVNTDAYSTAITIDDTGSAPAQLQTTTDLSITGLGVWEGWKYCIVREIYKHIDSAETPGDLITSYDPFVTLTCAATIEHTSGYSTKNYQKMTPLQILTDLAGQDAAVFWVTLGGTTVTWESDFGASAVSFDDSNVLAWNNGEYDFTTMYNKWLVYGARSGDEQIKEDDSDATSVSKYGTRTNIMVSAGIISSYDAEEVAGALVDTTKNVNLYLEAILPALDSSFRLGTVLKLSSTHLGITNALGTSNYVVSSWSYNSDTHQTVVRLHPHSTVGYVDHLKLGDYFRAIDENTKKATRNIYTPTLTTQTW